MNSLIAAILLTAYFERLREYADGRPGNYLDDELVQEGMRLQLRLPCS